MKKQISAKAHKSLIEYYIQLLEREDLFSVTFHMSENNKKFIINPFHKETFLHENKDHIKIPRSKLTESFIGRDNNNQKSIFYGYPIVITTNGSISPLFFIELIVEEEEAGHLIFLRKTKPDLNHSILSAFGFEIEEIKKLRVEIQNKSFIEQITAILDLLHLPKTHITPDLDTEPLQIAKSPKICNKIILYMGVRTGITRNLIKELHRLKTRPREELNATSLGFFLGEKIYTNSKENTEKQLIEVYPLNDSQKESVKHALTRPFTVITGPPGTGKSQVVLNIIANAVYQNKTVLFSSKNNKAVDVVREKLQPILSKPLIVRMGAEPHRKNAKETLSILFPHTDTKNKNDDIYKKVETLTGLAQDISQINDQIKKMQEINSTIDRVQDEMYVLLQRIPPELMNAFEEDDAKKIDALNLQRNLKNLGDKSSLFYKSVHRLFQKRNRRKLQDLFENCYNVLNPKYQAYFRQAQPGSKEDINKSLQLILSSTQLIHSKKNMMSLERNLITAFEPVASLYEKVNHLSSDYTKISRDIFDEYWLNKLNSTNSEDQESVAKFFYASEQLQRYVEKESFKKLFVDWKKNMKRILGFLPIWVITNLSAKNSIPLENNLFDILIIDEASQCDIASAFPLFYRAESVVIIGDPKQLKHISLLNQEQDEQIAEDNNVKNLFNDYSYTKNSLYDLAEKICIDNRYEPILLNEHYRCSRGIITFSNENFYDNLLHVLTDELRLKPPDDLLSHGIIWYDICGKTIHDESSYNTEEAEYVVRLLEKLTSMYGTDISFGVVTFFRAQMELITQKITSSENLRNIDITVGTAHRFQGDEKDIIIFSPAVSSGVKSGTLAWIDSTSQLLNVAITRAKTAVIVVGDKKTCLKAKGVLSELVQYAQSPRTDASINTNDKILFYDSLNKNKIQVLQGYWARCKDNKKYRIDFVLFIHKNKYAFYIRDTPEDKNVCFDFDRYIALRNEGWKIRHIHNKKILEKPEELIEYIQRLC